jgi:hypothetical protein
MPLLAFEVDSGKSGYGEKSTFTSPQNSQTPQIPLEVIDGVRRGLHGAVEERADKWKHRMIRVFAKNNFQNGGDSLPGNRGKPAGLLHHFGNYLWQPV